MLLVVTNAFGNVSITRDHDLGFVVQSTLAETQYVELDSEFCILAGTTVDLRGQMHATAQSSSHVNALGASVTALSGARVSAEEGAFVLAGEGSHVMAYDGSTVEALPGSTVIAGFGSRVFTHPGSTVTIYGGADVITVDGFHCRNSSSSALMQRIMGR